ncbi:hypothetical protein [Pseudomonas silensiensis]
MKNPTSSDFTEPDTANGAVSVLDLLGKCSDRELSIKTGVSPYFLRMMRESLTIPSIKQSPYPDGLVDDLGEMPDRDISAKYNISKSRVFRIREKLGIARFPKGKVIPIVSSSPGDFGESQSQRLVDFSETNMFSNATENSSRQIGAVAHSQQFTPNSAVAVVSTLGSPSPLGKCTKAKSRSKLEWSTEAISLLGTMTDANFARIFGVSTFTVQKKRSELNIPSFAKSLWTEDLIAMLGTVPDMYLSLISGFSLPTIVNARIKENIPEYSAVVTPQADISLLASETYEQKQDEIIKALGKRDDREISLQFKIPLVQVIRLRLDLGIPRVYGPNGNKKSKELELLLSKIPANVVSQIGTMPYKGGGRIWSVEQISALGTDSDANIAKQLGFTYNQVFFKRTQLGIPLYRLWTAEFTSLLGAMTDADFALTVAGGKFTPEQVYNKRASLGIPAFNKTWTPENLALLGEMTDKEVAEQIGNGITFLGVRKKRRALNIKACRISKAPKAPRALDECWTDDVLSQLGKISDYKLSKQTGIERSRITLMRQSLSIPSSSNAGKKWNWTDEQISIIGTMSDLEAAAKIGYGIGVSTVRAKRLALGIIFS